MGDGRREGGVEVGLQMEQMSRRRRQQQQGSEAITFPALQQGAGTAAAVAEGERQRGLSFSGNVATPLLLLGCC